MRASTATWILSATNRAASTVGRRLQRLAVDHGWRAEKKWRDLSAYRYGEYLADEHPDRRWFVKFVERVAPCKVLEIGAGSLHEARLLFQGTPTTGIEYTVVDVASNMIELGRREFPMVRFVEGNINRLQFPDDEFDIVYCRHVLEHQPYYEGPVREMMRVSKGLVVLNLFRWSLRGDVIRRQGYYSNSYDIGKLLTFIRGLATSYEYCLVQKGDKPGENGYEDQNIRRTGDHLVFVAAKHAGVSFDPVYQALERSEATYVSRPYGSQEDS